MEFGVVARWLVVLVLLAGLGLPLAARTFERLDGRGVGLALPVAFVTVWWGAYLVGQLTYGTHATLAGLAFLVLVAAALSVDVDVGVGDSVALSLSLPPLDRRAAGQAAGVFLAAFALVVAVRALDPAVGPLGGEKFLDYGMLEALARADRLPPEDFWFAGEPVAYYYGGHLLAATLGDLAGTGPRLTYNLALAAVYAALVAAVYDVAAAVGVRRGLDRRVTGGTAAVLVGLSANLLAAADVLLVALPDAVAHPLAAAASDRPPAQVVRDAAQFGYFEYSRVIPGTINEFPLFAWLNGDLHAHMTSTPFAALVVGLCLAYAVTPADEVRRRRLLAFGAVPAVAGVLAVVNTWSFPTPFGLLWLTLALSPTDPLDLLPAAVAAPVRERLPRGPAGELLRPVVAALPAVGAAAVACALAAPFLFGAAADAASNRSVALLAADERSSAGGLLAVHGVFLAAGWAALVAETRGRTLPLAAGVAVLAPVALSLSAPVLALVTPLVALGWAARRFDGAGFEAVLLVGGAGLVTLTEFVYLVELAGPLRMNTVFKTYSQVWVLWGIGAGVAGPLALARLGGATGTAGAGTSGTAADGSGVRARVVTLEGPPRRTLATLLAVVLLCSTLVYGAQALPAHAETGRADPTLDARAFVSERHPGAAPAIAYLDRVPGTPTLLSAPATALPPPGGSPPAPPGMYSWTSAPAASMTGVPTVAGWRHEVGYRGRAAYVTRVRAADEMYRASPERRVALVREYGVDYVWVGEAERARYGDVSFDRIDGVEPVVETETVTLYAVDRDALTAR
jgi:YYY domain-containing protein